jgi:hypothetical protein
MRCFGVAEERYVPRPGTGASSDVVGASNAQAWWSGLPSLLSSRGEQGHSPRSWTLGANSSGPPIRRHPSLLATANVKKRMCEQYTGGRYTSYNDYAHLFSQPQPSLRPLAGHPSHRVPRTGCTAGRLCACMHLLHGERHPRGMRGTLLDTMQQPASEC